MRTKCPTCGSGSLDRPEQECGWCGDRYPVKDPAEAHAAGVKAGLEMAAEIAAEHKREGEDFYRANIQTNTAWNIEQRVRALAAQHATDTPQEGGSDDGA